MTSQHTEPATGPGVVLYRAKLTEIEYLTDAILPDALTVEAMLPRQGDPFVRLGDRDLDYREAMALADVLVAAASTIAPDATEGGTRFGRALGPTELSAPTPGQRALASHRATLSAVLVGLVTAGMVSRWTGWWRIVTEDLTAHLAQPLRSAGEVLCGYQRQHPTAGIVELDAPGEATNRAERMCTACTAAAAGVAGE